LPAPTLSKKNKKQSKEKIIELVVNLAVVVATFTHAFKLQKHKFGPMYYAIFFNDFLQ